MTLAVVLPHCLSPRTLFSFNTQSALEKRPNGSRFKHLSTEEWPYLPGHWALFFRGLLALDPSHTRKRTKLLFFPTPLKSVCLPSSARLKWIQRRPFVLPEMKRDAVAEEGRARGVIHCNLINTSRKRAGVPSQPLSCLFRNGARLDLTPREVKRGLARGKASGYIHLFLCLFLCPQGFLSLSLSFPPPLPSIFLSLGPRGPSSRCERMNDVIQVPILTQRLRKA